MVVECFARRIMAPFQGVLQMLRVGAGEAESLDGSNWVLYVAHPEILAHSGLSEVRFGTWSAEQGLRRAMVRGCAAGGLIERIGEPLIAALEQHAARVPFVLRDSREYWLLDARSGVPLVLLDTLLAEQPLPPAVLPNWLPGKAARDGFAGLAELEAMLLNRAGRRPLAQWFDRDPRGAGTTAGGERLAAGFFPRLLMTTDWPDPGQRRLAESFITWWAPALLQLQHLDDVERSALERAAAGRATAMARLFPLYPKTLDTDLLRVARVQARLQSSGALHGGYQEPFLWTE